MNKYNKITCLSIILIFLISFSISPYLQFGNNLRNTIALDNLNASGWETGDGELSMFNETIEECDDLQETIYYNFTADLLDSDNCSHNLDAGFLETEFKDGTWHSPDTDNITVQDLINYNDYIAGFDDFYDIVGDLSGWVNLSLDDCNDGLYSTFYSTEVENYTATFSFTNDTIGGDPANFTVYEGGGTVEISESIGNHRKVVDLCDNNFGDHVEIIQFFSENRTNGIIEWWWRENDVSWRCKFILWDSGTNLFELGISGNAFYNDGGAIGVGAADNTWYHIKVLFECGTDGLEGLAQYSYRVYINGVEIGDYNFLNNQPQVDWATWETHDIHGNYHCYVDAVGYSWDTDYLLGDNYNWNYYPATHDFENYNITHDGNYYATYSFVEDAVGATGTTIGFVDHVDGDANTDVVIYHNLGGHNKLLRLDDNNAGGALQAYAINDFSSTQESGTIEFWIRFADNINPDNHVIRIYSAGVGDGIDIEVRNDNFRYYDGALHTICAAVINTWYHVRIDFECGAGGYAGLSADRWRIFINDVEYGEYQFRGVVASMGHIRFDTWEMVGGQFGDFYVDAVGYSWDAGYNQLEDTWNFPNDYKSWNKNPYDLTTNLFLDDWDYYGVLGGTYSIDGEFGIHKKYLEIYDDTDTDFYRATYSFEDDLNGAFPSGWIDGDTAGCTTSVISNLDGHRKVAQLYDGGAGLCEMSTTFSDKSSGTIEWWWRQSATNKRSTLELLDGAVIGILIRLDNDANIKYLDGGLQTIVAYAANTWYHIRIDFECDTGTYMGLAADTFYIYIDGIQYGPYNFNVGVDAIDSIIFRTEGADITYYQYIDAVGFSWDLNYIFDYHDDSDNSVDIGTQVWNTFDENQTECCLSFWINGDFDDYHSYFRIYLMQENDFITSIKINNSELWYLDGREWVLGDDSVANDWIYIRMCFNTTSDTYDLYFDLVVMNNTDLLFYPILIDSDIPFQQTTTGIDRIMFETCYSASPTFYMVDAMQYGWDCICNEYWDCGTSKWDLTIDANTDIGINGTFAGYTNVLNMSDNGGGLQNPEIDRDFCENVTEGCVEFDVYIDGTNWGIDAFIMELWGDITRVFSLQFYGGVIDTYWTSVGLYHRTDAWITIQVCWNATDYWLYVNGTLAETGLLAYAFPINNIHFEMMYTTDDNVYLDNIIADFWVDCFDYNLIPTSYAELEFKVGLYVDDPYYIASCIYWAFLTTSSELVNFSWYNYDTDQWDLITIDTFDGDVPPVGFTCNSNCSGCFNSTFLDPYINSSGYITFSFHIIDFEEEFEFYIDELRLRVRSYVHANIQKSFCWRGIWRYRWWLRIDNGTWLWNNWTYFEVIPLYGCCNFEGVSESPYTTFWELIGTGTVPIERFHDDIGVLIDWVLIDGADDTFYAYLSESYLFDNSSSTGILDYTGVHWDTIQAGTPLGITTDGTYLWIVDRTDKKVYKFTTEGVYTGDYFSISGQFGYATGIVYNGTNFLITDITNDEVYEYSAAGVYTGVHWDTSSEETSPQGIGWDGTHFWVVGIDSDRVYKYTSYGTYTGTSFDVSSEDTWTYGITWDGTHFWTVGGNTNYLYQYTAAGVYTGTSISSAYLNPSGIEWDGTYIWVSSNIYQEVHQYGYLYETSKKYHGGGYVYMQTNVSESLHLRGDPYGAIFDIYSGEYFDLDIESTASDISMKLYLSGVEQVELTVLSGNTETDRQTVRVYLESDVEFDQIEFIGHSLVDTEHFICYDILGEGYGAADLYYDMYVDPDGKDCLMAQVGDYLLNIYEREGGSFSLKESQNITLTYDLLTVIYVPQRRWYLKIYHYAYELSNIVITGTENLTLTAGKNEILELYLLEGNYEINWTNGENGVLTTYNINLYSDQSLVLDTTYYTVYFSLYDQNGHRLDDILFSLYLNSSRKDFGFVELRTERYNITVYDWLNVTVYNEIEIDLDDYAEYNIYITVFELQIRHLGYENSNITLCETTTHSCFNFSMSSDTLRSFMLANSTYNVTWVNGEDGVSTTYDITLDTDYILTLETTYFSVYFGLFTYDGLGLDRDTVRFYINNERKDFGFNTLKQNTNTLTVLDFFNHTLFNKAVDLSGYSEYNIFVTIYTLFLYNNYTFPIDIVIERNNIEMRCSLAPQMFTQYRFVPNVEYYIIWYYENGTKIDDMELEFEENGQIVSFGFFEEEMPFDPEPIINSFNNILILIFFFVGILLILTGIVLYLKKKNRELQERDKYFNHKLKPTSYSRNLTD